jgi:YD repeat-containing protein
MNTWVCARKVPLTIKNYFVVMVIAFVVFICFDQIVLATTYKYDNLHRLTRVTYNNGMYITYTYDEVGNRTQRVATLTADTFVDGTVNFQDFAILASRWLEEGCVTPDWCQGADLNWNAAVNIEDLVILAQQWLEGV